MSLSRRSALKIALGAGALPLWVRLPAGAERSPVAGEGGCGRLGARPLPLEAVRLTGGPLLRAQELDAAYLLTLEPDRMLAYYRQRAGLTPKAEPYGGWDGGGRNLTGHIAGHYLSAVSVMWAATGDARFAERARYLVAELAAVQEAHGDGYLSALDGGRRAFGELARGEIRSRSFDLNGEWSPWYTLHKTYAGLRDAYRYTGNRTALAVEVAFAGWAEGVLTGLDDAQVQAMLGTEFGGMNEVLVDLYGDTGDERWLELSYKFEHEPFIAPLRRHRDDLAGTHGNTQVPKLLGSADRYVATGEAADLIAAAYFWDQVVQHHSFATGGHGTDEYFGEPDRLSGRADGRTAETCNVYNMLKLTRRLFSIHPDPHYADFHERALFNHVLASIDPTDGRTCYMVPVGRGVEREYQDMESDFTCCVGTGMESHGLHGDGLYYEAGDVLWVPLYVPSTARWEAAGLDLRLETDFPEGESAKLTLSLGAPRAFTLALRRPHWAGDAFAVRVNGEEVDLSTGGGGPSSPPDRSERRQYDFPDTASTFVRLERTWRSGDLVEVTLPKTLRLEPLPGEPRRTAVLWGPLVLAGDLGPETGHPAASEVPALVVEDGQAPAAWIETVSTDPLRFRTVGAGRRPRAAGGASEVELAPFYRLHRRTYAATWDLFTPEEWEAQKARYGAEDERRRALEAATVAYLEPGETVFERRFGYLAGEGALKHRILGRPGRRGPSWFSYEIPVEPDHPMTLLATYYSGDRRGTPADFEVLVDGTRVAEQSLGLSDPHRFFDLAYPLAPELVAGKGSVTVRFQAKEGGQIATVFSLRMIRDDRR